MRKVAVALLAVGLATTAVPSADAAKKFHVSIAQEGEWTSLVPDVVVLKGKVRPAKGGKVTVQQGWSKNGPWKKAGKAKLDAQSKYVFRDYPTTERTRWYRACHKKQGKVAAGCSKPLKVAKVRYRGDSYASFYDLVPTAQSGVAKVESIPLAPNTGVFSWDPAYSQATATRALTDVLPAGQTSSITFARKDYSCSFVTLTPFLAATSAVGASAQVRVYFDGVLRAVRDLAGPTTNSSLLRVEAVDRFHEVRFEFVPTGVGNADAVIEGTISCRKRL